LKGFFCLICVHTFCNPDGIFLLDRFLMPYFRRDVTPKRKREGKAALLDSQHSNLQDVTRIPGAPLGEWIFFLFLINI